MSDAEEGEQTAPVAEGEAAADAERSASASPLPSPEAAPPRAAAADDAPAPADDVPAPSAQATPAATERSHAAPDSAAASPARSSIAPPGSAAASPARSGIAPSGSAAASPAASARAAAAAVAASPRTLLTQRSVASEQRRASMDTRSTVQRLQEQLSALEAETAALFYKVVEAETSVSALVQSEDEVSAKQELERLRLQFLQLTSEEGDSAQKLSGSGSLAYVSRSSLLQVEGVYGDRYGPMLRVAADDELVTFADDTAARVTRAEIGVQATFPLQSQKGTGKLTFLLLPKNRRAVLVREFPYLPLRVDYLVQSASSSATALSPQRRRPTRAAEEADGDGDDVNVDDDAE